MKQNARLFAIKHCTKVPISYETILTFVTQCLNKMDQSHLTILLMNKKYELLRVRIIYQIGTKKKY